MPHTSKALARAPRRPGKDQPIHDAKEGEGSVEGKGDGQGGGVVAGVRRAAAVTAFRLEDGQYKVVT